MRLGPGPGVGCLWDAAPPTCGMLLDLMRLGFFAFSWLDVFGVFMCSILGLHIDCVWQRIYATITNIRNIARGPLQLAGQAVLQPTPQPSLLLG